MISVQLELLSDSFALRLSVRIVRWAIFNDEIHRQAPLLENLSRGTERTQRPFVSSAVIERRQIRIPRRGQHNHGAGFVKMALFEDLRANLVAPRKPRRHRVPRGIPRNEDPLGGEFTIEIRLRAA